MQLPTLRLFLLATLIAAASAWSRFNVGDKVDRRGNKSPITCGGALMSEQIAKNVRGENPDVPVSLIARYPLLDPFVKFLSDFHVYCAIALLLIVMFQMLRKVKADSFHVCVGRIASYLIAPHYVLIGCILNYYAINLDLKDWLLAPPASDWRLQISYIIPFAINTQVSMCMGFFLCRYSFMPQWTATLLKWLSGFSIVFWMTIGLYQTGSQAFGLGLGSFGLPVEKSVPGGTADAQPFFDGGLNLIVFFVGTFQAGQDYIAYKCLSLVEKSGNAELAWKDMHKWAMIDLTYQAGVIFALFLAFFPYCLYGLPEWTCIESPFFAAPVITVFLVPVLLQASWIAKFLAALFGPADAIKAFSKPNHKWDTKLKA